MRAIESFEIEAGELSINVSVICFDCYDGFSDMWEGTDKHQGGVTIANPEADRNNWKYFIPKQCTLAERLLEWQRLGLQYTASGYGTKIPTSKVIKWSDGRERRVYCDIYSNIGSCYCMIYGCKVSVEGFNLISEATR